MAGRCGWTGTSSAEADGPPRLPGMSFRVQPSNADPRQDLALLQASAGELQDYLLSDRVFWQLHTPQLLPGVSLGALLLVRRRLEARSGLLGREAEAAARRGLAEVEAGLARWRVAAERKAERELPARLNLWSRFLDEWAADGPPGPGEYAAQVTQRVIAELLLGRYPHLAGLPAAAGLPALDSRLRGRLGPGGFAWPADLQSAFPAGPFWPLYGAPRPAK